MVPRGEAPIVSGVSDVSRMVRILELFSWDSELILYCPEALSLCLI